MISYGEAKRMFIEYASAFNIEINFQNFMEWRQDLIDQGTFTLIYGKIHWTCDL